MKKKVIFALVLGLCISISACGNTSSPNQNSAISSSSDVNHYEASASKYIQWFEATPADFMNDFNAALPSDIEIFQPLDGKDTLLSNNGDTWKISLQTHLSPTSEEAEGKIAHIELDLFSNSTDDDVINGKLIRTLLNTLNPNHAQEIETALGIYEDSEEVSHVTENSTEVCYGNVRYHYCKGEFLRAFPVAEFTEEEHVPIQPE